MEIQPKAKWFIRDIYDMNTLHINCFEGDFTYKHEIDTEIYPVDSPKTKIKAKTFERYYMAKRVHPSINKSYDDGIDKWIDYVKIILTHPDDGFANALFKKYVGITKKTYIFKEYIAEEDRYVFIEEPPEYKSEEFKRIIMLKPRTNVQMVIFHRLMKNIPNLKIVLYAKFVKDSVKGPVKEIQELLLEGKGNN